ncbi:sugar transferase [Nitratireductor basaltis]|uniref:Sugar transferase n=1 Tax=Nitratireductor basaltis TaxID=472175 RepID=A0A084UCN5_9HYPH|nr:sugar transferase [Nitratireductor basaltis]KFB10721.1 Sugar transferase precursor [Nitratireductor basaltis]
MNDNTRSSVDPQATRGFYPRLGKRLLDLCLTIPCGLVALPVIGIAAIAIRRNSHGPAIFAQERVGLNGRVFRCYKLRSMYVDAPSVPTHEAAQATITPVGRFLRRTKIDELPQLWNVLLGDMSLVGPRPCLPSQHELIAARQSRRVLEIRPGITGLAQVQGIDMSRPQILAEADLRYMRSMSALLDLRLLVQTVMGGS